MSDETGASKPLHVTLVEVDPKSICENVVHDVNKNLSNVARKDDILSDNDLEANQDDDNNVIKDFSTNKEEIITFQYYIMLYGLRCLL